MCSAPLGSQVSFYRIDITICNILATAVMAWINKGLASVYFDCIWKCMVEKRNENVMFLISKSKKKESLLLYYKR